MNFDYVSLRRLERFFTDLKAWLASKYATKEPMTGATSQSAGEAGLVPAPAAGDQESFLKGDGTWTALENDVVGTQLLGENGQPMLDETTQEPIYDAYSTDQLWTGFAGKKFGAARAVADQDGNVFGDTYATKNSVITSINELANSLELMPLSDVSIEINPRFTSIVSVGSGTFYKAGDLIILSGFNLVAHTTDAFDVSDSDPLYIGSDAVAIATITGITTRVSNNLHLLNQANATSNWFTCSMQTRNTVGTILAVGRGLRFPTGGNAWYGGINTVII